VQQPATVIPANKWRTSTRTSQAGNAQCVELAVSTEQTFIRDSKNRSGEVLAFGPAAFERFLAGIKRHEFGS
jgi:Domain of unknown function (DUF397)